MAFSIADGQLPSNAGAGYVIRRILRRAVRYGYSFLGLDRPFLFELVDVMADQMGDFFPELRAQQTLIAKVMKEEEEGFLRTLDKGIQRLDEKIAGAERLDGDAAFELYDTYGFPIDLTALICGENGVEVDQAGFEAALARQKDRSRAAGKVEAGDWNVLEEDRVEEFVGYDRMEAEVRITRWREVKVKDKTRFQLVFNLTPFYPEGGGQVGDTGQLVAPDGTVLPILTTRKENELILHIAEQCRRTPPPAFTARVHGEKRRETTLNHTATHLLHEALRDVLGTHVEQKGSLVKDAALRFDFSHFQKVTPEELLEVEQKVNAAIRENRALDERRNIPLDEAKAAGAMMLFGEKYGDTVRMIGFGSSIELCGGTHVGATGEIGLFRITSEGAVAAGIRRIEAETGQRAVAGTVAQRDLLRRTSEALKGPADLVAAVEDLQSKVASSKRKSTPTAGSKPWPSSANSGRHPPPGWRWHTGHARHGSVRRCRRHQGHRLPAQGRSRTALCGVRQPGRRKTDPHVPHHGGVGTGKGMECRTARPGYGDATSRVAAVRPSLRHGGGKNAEGINPHSTQPEGCSKADQAKAVPPACCRPGLGTPPCTPSRGSARRMR